MKNKKRGRWTDILNLLLVIIIPFIFGTISRFIPSSENRILAYIIFFSIYITSFLIILGLLKITGTRFSEFGFSFKKLGRTILIALGFILLGFLSSLIISIFSPAVPSAVEESIEPMKIDIYYFLMQFLYSFILVALIEDMERTLIFLKAEKLFGVYGAYFFSALAFGLAHVYVGVSAMVTAFTGGLLLNLLWLIRKRNLLPVVVAHGGYDFILDWIRDSS